MAKRSDAPRLGGDDSFEIGPTRRLIDQGADQKGLEGALDRVLQRMSASGEEAESEYQTALGALREFGGEATAAIGLRLRLLPEDAYLERWFLVQALVDTRDPSATRLFDEILDTPIPPEKSNYVDHQFSTVGEEVVIRTTAIEGLSRLADRGEKPAVQSLERHARHEQRTVRHAALRALGVHDDALAARIIADLPKDERAALRAKAVDVRDIPQPEEGKLVRRGLIPTEDQPPPPTLPEGSRLDVNERRG